MKGLGMHIWGAYRCASRLMLLSLWLSPIGRYSRQRRSCALRTSRHSASYCAHAKPKLRRIASDICREVLVCRLDTFPAHRRAGRRLPPWFAWPNPERFGGQAARLSRQGAYLISTSAEPPSPRPSPPPRGRGRHTRRPSNMPSTPDSRANRRRFPLAPAEGERAGVRGKSAAVPSRARQQSRHSGR